ncbi:alginate export family protein [Methylococcus geothermalis]|uniref:Alginate export domain-containing protein n=1 Tax=Methylococcus geothermalis TaxID=2681310 RepID=A0A858QB90_9GAMM|nr:alginate export family protein [Methylococcus geothermalis]QJD31169.1 hypothetical protein GNH96_15285 [Methylococcus geothermalis]
MAQMNANQDQTKAAPLSSGAIARRSKTAGTVLFSTLLALSEAAWGAEADKQTKPSSALPTEWAGPADTRIKLEVFDRARGEFADWFGNPLVKGKPVPKDYNYSFVGNKFQLGLRVSGEPFEAFAQFQDTYIGGLPTNGVGIGAAYYASTPLSTQNGAFLRQGWLRLKDMFGVNGLYLNGGRQLFSDGQQGLARHKNLRWIQDYRIAQRLIGPFEYTHAGRSFDGGSVGYLTDDLEAVGFGFMPTFGGFESNGMPTIGKVNVAGASLSLRDSENVGHTIGRLSWYYYSDDRDILFVDNRPLAARKKAVGQGSAIHTIGGHLAHVEDIGPGVADGTVYAFGQVGNWQNQNQAAWAFGVEAGYQFREVWAAPWLRAGINSGSGDDNPNDNTHGTFFQMLPTAWLYAQFPFYNMMNNQDVFVQGILTPDPKLSLRLDFHALRVNAAQDFVYSGSGATNDTVFGYVGTPTGGASNLAYLTHVMINMKPIDHLAFNLFYGHAFGQSIINNQYDGKQGNYGFLEAIVSF